MYSPKIKEKLILVLYRIAKEQGRPMTKLVNEMIERGIKSYQQQRLKISSQVNDSVLIAGTGVQ